MCDVESYIYLPMLEELGYVPKHRYAFGEEIRLHLQAIADRFDLVADALFHTGVTRAEWDEDAARWRVRTDRGDELTCRYYVLAVGILNLHEAAGHRRAWRTSRGHVVPHRALGLRATPAAARASRSPKLGDKVVGAHRHRRHRHPVPAAAGRGGQARLRVPAHAVGHRRARQPAHRARLRRQRCEPGWQQARMDNFQAIMLGKPVDADLVDDGWTHHYAAVHHPPRRKGMTLEEYIRSGEEVDFGIMEEHRRRVDGARDRSRDGRDPQAVLPLPVQAAVLPRRVPARVQQRPTSRSSTARRASTG